MSSNQTGRRSTDSAQGKALFESPKWLTDGLDNGTDMHLYKPAKEKKGETFAVLLPPFLLSFSTPFFIFFLPNSTTLLAWSILFGPIVKQVVLPVFHKFMAKYLEEDNDGNLSMVSAVPVSFF